MNIIFCSPGGRIAPSSSASRTTGGDSRPLNRWMTSSAALLDRLGDGGMVVTERGAHLAGAEIEDLAALVVVDVAALGPHSEVRRKGGDIADHVLVGRFLQPAEVATALSTHLAISPRLVPTSVPGDPSIVLPFLRPLSMSELTCSHGRPLTAARRRRERDRRSPASA